MRTSSRFSPPIHALPRLTGLIRTPWQSAGTRRLPSRV